MEIRLLKKEEFHSLETSYCELYRHCFNDYIDEHIIDHRFMQNPYDEFYMCVAIDNGSIVANYTVSPTRIAHNGKVLKAALSLNTMTHPAYVGKGLFVTLAKHLYDNLTQDGFSLVYGFPNYLSNRTFVSKLGWRDIYEIPTLELLIDESKIVNAVALKRELPLNCHKNNLNSDESYEVFKDLSYLNWRYIHSPNNKYMILATKDNSWVIYKFYQDIINVVEFHANNSDEIKDIVNQLMVIGIQNKKTRITVWSKINSDQHILLEKLGFRNRYPITYFGAKILRQEDCEGIWNYQNWTVNMGDDNVY